MEARVYIIIVNYKGFEDTIECLESVLKSSYSNFQIFVVDNSPNDLPLGHLSNWISNNAYNEIKTNFANLVFPLHSKPLEHTIVDETKFNEDGELYENTVTIIKAKNRGFAAANNVVLRYLLKNGFDPYFVWILNNDTVVEKDTLTHLVNFYRLNEHAKVMLGSKLRYYHAPEKLQAIAGYYNKWIGKHFHIGEGEEDLGRYDSFKPGNGNYIIGASIFLPKLFLEQAGLMCEDYFLYFEELDWAQNGIRHGFTLDIEPKAIVYHKEGASIIDSSDEGKDTFIAEYYSITNRVRFIKKWYPYCLITVMPGVIFALVKRIMMGKLTLVKKTTKEILKIFFTG